MLGTDTDSIAAFTGGIIGALYGDNIIPDKWKNVQDIKYLDNIAKYLLAISEDRLDNEISYPIKDCIINNHVKEDYFKVNDYISFSPLGEGRIISIDRQKTVTKGKYNLLLNINLDIGQSIILSHLMDDNNSIFERDKNPKD